MFLQSKHSVIFGILLILVSNLATAQSDYIPLHHKQYTLFDRLDIKTTNDSIFGFSTMKTFNRRAFTNRVQDIDSLDKAAILPFTLSKIDRHNIQQLLMANNEWSNYDATHPKRKGLWNTFYRNNGNMYQVKTHEFHMSVNPVLNLTLGSTNDGTGRTYINTRGILVRGHVNKQIGFYTFFSENQEITPDYVRQWERTFSSLPGMGYYKRGTSLNNDNRIFDYFDSRGGFTFNGGKHFDFTFGYDKLFLGNGIRSLMLSDFTAPYLFLRARARVWKFDYQNVFAQMVETHRRTGDFLRPQKFMAMHHLSYQVSKRLNIGLYENVMFGRANGFELSYLNPVIFYRSVEQQLGSPDKVTVGLDFKSNLAKKFQLYGQLVITEFVASEVLNYRRGDWRNKHAAQLGAKYIDAFGVNNLDLQVEYNWLRPFTYTHRDSTGVFAHYNQPLAHPLGASVREVVAQVRYQPLPKLFVFARAINYLHGTDPAGQNWGGNIFLPYNLRTQNQGIFVGDKIPQQTFFMDANVSYELIENIFFDVNAQLRRTQLNGVNTNHSFFSLGIRANVQRRTYEF